MTPPSHSALCILKNAWMLTGLVRGTPPPAPAIQSTGYHLSTFLSIFGPTPKSLSLCLKIIRVTRENRNYVHCTKKRFQYSGGLNLLFRRINFSILGHGTWFLKTCISVLLPEATLVLGFKIVSPVRNLIVNNSIITQYYRVVILFLIATELAFKSFVKF